MIQTAPTPDTTPLKQIVKKNRLPRLNITDFKIINGLRMYKIEWVELKDNQQKFKWQMLRNLQPFIDDVMIYQQRNKLKISHLEKEWEQYFYDGQVKKPLQYFALKKILQESEDISNDGDSQFEIGRKDNKKVNNKLKSILKGNKKKKKARRFTNRTPKPKKAKNLQNQHQTIEPIKQNEREKVVNKNENREMSLQAELQKYLLDWTLQVPYLELENDDPNQISPTNKANQVNYQTPKKDTEYLPATLHQHQSQSNQQQNNENEQKEQKEESQRSSYKLFTSEQQNDDSNQLQSYEEVEQEQCQYQRPQNMRQFIKQQMIALNIESPSELLNSSPKLKIQDTFSDKSQIQNQDQKQQIPDHFQVENNNIKKECQIEVKQQEKVFSLAQLFQKIDSMSYAERSKTKRDSNYKYIYQNILSADIFWCYPLPPISRINKIISYGSLTLYSVNVRTQTSQIQKFVLPELMTKYYPQLYKKFFNDY